MKDLEKLEQKTRKDFGKKLLKLIESKNKSQIDFCKDTKIPLSTLGDWCSGRNYPRISKMLFLADYFGISYEELISTEKPKNQYCIAKNYKLCYVEGQKAYFTSNFEKQWGDDWNDRPYEDNAGSPYEHYFENEKEIPIYIETLYFETDDWSERKPCDVGRFSVEQINKGAVAWVITDKFCIQAGTTMKDFIEIITKNGGAIWKKM